MTLYYVLALIFSLILTFCLYRCFKYFVALHKSKADRGPVTYFMPVILALALCIFSVGTMAPLLLDLISVYGGGFDVLTVNTDEITAENNGFSIEDNYFAVPPDLRKIEKGKIYRISYTPHSKLVISIEVSEGLSKENEQN